MLFHHSRLDHVLQTDTSNRMVTTNSDTSGSIVGFTLQDNADLVQTGRKDTREAKLVVLPCHLFIHWSQCGLFHDGEGQGRTCARDRVARQLELGHHSSKILLHLHVGLKIFCAHAAGTQHLPGKDECPPDNCHDRTRYQREPEVLHHNLMQTGKSFPGRL